MVLMTVHPPRMSLVLWVSLRCGTCYIRDSTYGTRHSVQTGIRFSSKKQAWSPPQKTFLVVSGTIISCDVSHDVYADHLLRVRVFPLAGRNLLVCGHCQCEWPLP